MKRILVLLLASTSLLGSQCLVPKSDAVKFKRSEISASQSLGKVRLSRDEDGFKVKQNGKISYVNSYDVEKPLRNLNSDQLAKLRQAGAMLKVSQMKNGDFTVGLDGQLKGGGIGGAYWGAASGKFLVHLAFQGVVGVVSGVVSMVATPAAGVAVAVAMEKTFLVPVEVLSNTAAVAGGIAGAVATGPV